MFALRHKATGKLLRFRIETNNGVECSSETRRVFELDEDYNIFITNHADEADYVRRHGDWWFNGVEHDFKPDELEVVTVTLSVEPTNMDSEPVGKCNKCGRKIWKAATIGEIDAMVEPSGEQCGGMFVAFVTEG